MAFLSPASLPVSLNSCRHRHIHPAKTTRRPPSSCASPPTKPTAPNRASSNVPNSASLDNLLSTLPAEPDSSPPHVHLVGTGPGDPTLLTLRSLHLLRSAQTILYDRLVTPEILSLASPQARLVYVGKESGFHTRTQDQIHQLLSYFCELGTVVRLKGGDPFVFGRGGEEVDFLRERGVQVSISPGITAAAGIAAEVGIPLTMRGTASAVKFVTGHAQDGSVELGKIEAGVTYVIYMGLGMLDVVTKRFKDAEQAGVACCAVERGTTDRQRVVSGVVGSIVGKVSDAGLKSPTLVVIGEVVRKCFLWDMEGVWEGRVGNVLGLEDLDVGFDLGLGKERIETPEQLVMPEQ